MKKVTILIFLLVIIPSFMLAQKQNVLRANGQIFNKAKINNSGEIRHVFQKGKPKSKTFKNRHYKSINGTIDSISWDVPHSTRFGFTGQQIFVQWFVAPGDMIIKSAGYNIAVVDSQGTQLKLKLVKLNWTWDDILNTDVKLLGYYQAFGNGNNDATAFLDNPDRTGNWVDIYNTGAGEPFGNDLWSDNGQGVSTTPVADESYQWVDMNQLGVEPQVNQGDIIGVVLKNDEEISNHNWVKIWADNTLGIPGFKYYANGRLDIPYDYGWWPRNYTWDFALIVDYIGDTAPEINTVEELVTTLSTNDRTVHANVTDSNPSGGAAGIASVELFYSINDDTTWTEVPMTGTEPYFDGIIPGQQPGTPIEYYVVATDVAGNRSESRHFRYYIFKAANASLLVFNGYSTPTGYPQEYYFFGGDGTFHWEHDVWAYGSLTAELLNNYTYVIYITTNMHQADWEELTVLRNWVDSDNTHYLMIAGDQWLDFYNDGWVSPPYEAGDFRYDILGIVNFHDNINYNSPGDELLPSEVQPIQNTWLGGPLYDKYQQFATDSSWTNPMLYNPTYEFGPGLGINNWLDGVDFLSDVEVDLTGTAKDGVTKYPIAGHRKLPAGNKIAFFSFDPLSLDSDLPEYYWYGGSYYAPQINLLNWFNYPPIDDVKQIGTEIPDKFALNQNYPNPFNPTTIIKYSLPVRQAGIPAVETRHALSVQLEIYDVLGREIRTLVNEKQSPGNYQVQFDASELPSGVYIYRLQAGSFNQSKKMILLR